MEVEAHAPSSHPLNLDNNANIPPFAAFSIRAPEPSDQMADINGAFDRTAEGTAAMKVQKVYRSYRTRRMLADSAIVAEELWWQVLDFAQLKLSTETFYNLGEPEKAAGRWNRVGLNASKVGKGLSKDAKAQKLAFQHWIEAVDPRHRYGHNLHFYYDAWSKTTSGQPFFYWLDLGEGREVDLEDCPRSKLRKQCVKYLGPQEREHYEYMVVDGKILHKLTGEHLDTTKGSPGSKWIFVMSTSKRLYAGPKKKGLFHHSSFLAGGATLAAGRIIVEDGVLKGISPYSGHYKPTDDSFETFLSFLKENGVNMDEVELKKANEDSEAYGNSKSSEDGSISEAPAVSQEAEASQPETKIEYRRTMSGGIKSPRADVPSSAILQRINSKKGAKSYQLGHQLSVKWSTGAGPRIGWIRDYPAELRSQALELTNLSPRTSPGLPTPRRMDALLSPSACLSSA